MSVLLALLASALWGTSDFLGGSASRRMPALSVVGGSQLIALLGLVPVAAATGALGADRGYVVPAVLAGACGLAGLGAFYRALAVGRMGVVAPVAALGAVVPVLAGLVEGERPSGLQLVGTAVALGGVVLASGPELQGGAGAKPLLLALVAALGFGLVLPLVARGGESSAVMTLLTMRLTSVGLLTLLLLAAARRTGWERGVRRADLRVLGVVGAFDVGANGAFAAAAGSAGALVSVTGVLASLYPVVTVVLARQLLGERMRPVQAAGTAAALAGVALLAAG